PAEVVVLFPMPNLGGEGWSFGKPLASRFFLGDLMVMVFCWPFIHPVLLTVCWCLNKFWAYLP
ncbi:hypothetical protein M8C21_012639, partial [Ambrosia artemisiifolia]